MQGRFPLRLASTNIGAVLEGARLVCSCVPASAHEAVAAAAGPHFEDGTLLMIQPGPGRTVDKLGNGQAEVVEITAAEGAAAIGFPLSQVRMPPNTLLAVMVRGEKVSVPNAGTVIRTGDTLLAIASVASREKVVKLFGGE